MHPYPFSTLTYLERWIIWNRFHHIFLFTAKLGSNMHHPPTSRYVGVLEGVDHVEEEEPGHVGPTWGARLRSRALPMAG